MKFIHAVVFNYEEYTSAASYGCDFTDWGQVCDGDYVVHALYSIDNKEVLFVNDNCHSNVESEIEKFLEGVEFCGHDAIVTNAFVVMGIDEDAYNDYAIKCHIDNGDYEEVV